MKKPAAVIALLALCLAACYPPPPVPPPRRPNPPGPPVNPDRDRWDNDSGDRDTQPTPPGQYPMARPTANPNEVISPYPPYNVIDVEGFRSGQLARDPVTRQIFVVP